MKILFCIEARIVIWFTKQGNYSRAYTHRRDSTITVILVVI